VPSKESSVKKRQENKKKLRWEGCGVARVKERPLFLFGGMKRGRVQEGIALVGDE